MLRESLMRMAQQDQLRTFAMHNRIAKSFALRFVAGETLADAIEAVRDINTHGMTATLDHLGENVSTREAAQSASEAAVDMLRCIAQAEVRCNASLKLTQLGMDLGHEIAFENIQAIVAEARRHHNFVRIDMESSDYVDRTLEITYRLFEAYPNVGTVVQSYLYRSERDVEQLIEKGIRVRLVKGAYLERAAVAFREKVDVDANYLRLMKVLLQRGNYPAIATHDPAMITATKRFAQEAGIGSELFEFQMLYGIRRDLQHQLRAENYNVRVYVPYGTQWYPYFMRRMAERPANLMFVLGNIGREALSRG